MTLEEAKTEVREVIRHAADGMLYPEERRRINAALSDMRVHARDDDHRHTRELESYLRMFESPRKALHAGYDQIRVRIISELDKIGRYISPLQ